MEGFFGASDIPGKNIWGPTALHDEQIFADMEVVCIGQSIGVIVADTETHARNAAALVKIEYEDLPALFTIEDAVAANAFVEVPPSILAEVLYFFFFFFCFVGFWGCSLLRTPLRQMLFVEVPPSIPADVLYLFFAFWVFCFPALFTVKHAFAEMLVLRYPIGSRLELRRVLFFILLFSAQFLRCGGMLYRCACLGILKTVCII